MPRPSSLVTHALARSRQSDAKPQKMHKKDTTLFGAPLVVSRLAGQHRSAGRISRKAAKPQKMHAKKIHDAVWCTPRCQSIGGPTSIGRENLTQSRKAAKNARKKNTRRCLVHPSLSVDWRANIDRPGESHAKPQSRKKCTQKRQGTEGFLAHRALSRRLHFFRRPVRCASDRSTASLLPFASFLFCGFAALRETLPFHHLCSPRVALIAIQPSATFLFCRFAASRETLPFDHLCSPRVALIAIQPSAHFLFCRFAALGLCVRLCDLKFGLCHDAFA